MGVYGYILVSVGLWVFIGVMGIYRFLWVSMDVYGYLWVSMGVMDVYWYLWVFMGFCECFWVSGCLWVFMGVYGCLWVTMGTYRFLWVYGCLWGLMGFWVSMGTYGWHECLWVLYLNNKNIAYFLIQESQSIWKLQKTSEITHVFTQIKKYRMHHGGEGLNWLVCFQYPSIKSLFSPFVHNILFRFARKLQRPREREGFATRIWHYQINASSGLITTCHNASFVRNLKIDRFRHRFHFIFRISLIC